MKNGNRRLVVGLVTCLTALLLLMPWALQGQEPNMESRIEYQLVIIKGETEQGSIHLTGLAQHGWRVVAVAPWLPSFPGAPESEYPKYIYTMMRER